jgi:hypothetical protein
MTYNIRLFSLAACKGVEENLYLEVGGKGTRWFDNHGRIRVLNP